MVNWLLDCSIYPTLMFLVSSTGLQRIQTIYSVHSPRWQTANCGTSVYSCQIQYMVPVPEYSGVTMPFTLWNLLVWTVVSRRHYKVSVNGDVPQASTTQPALLLQLPQHSAHPSYNITHPKVTRSLTYHSKDPPDKCQRHYIF